jgi:hypothetical protein
MLLLLVADMYYGPEFVSKVLHRWVYEQGVQLAFSRAGQAD